MPSTIHHNELNELIERLRAELPAMTAETEAIVHRDHPELVARVGPADVRLGVAHTHARFVAILEGTAPDDRDRHIAFGAATAAAGASVEELMAAYRVGAQVGWQRVLRHADELALPGPVALAVASKSMAYMDELAADSLEGFAREAAASQGARARARQALLDALLEARADDLPALATAAGWALPARVRVAVLLSAEGHRVDDRVLLVGRADGVAVAVARAGEEDALLGAGVPLAAGPEVDAAAAATSLAGARRLAALTFAGVLAPDAAHRWEDHLADLVVHADDAAGAALVARHLEPLRDPSPARERLLRETLQAWLDHPGRPREIARDLHLHHQTVRYRLTRLRERLGDGLDDPNTRFELQLALRLDA